MPLAVPTWKGAHGGWLDCQSPEADSVLSRHAEEAKDYIAACPTCQAKQKKGEDQHHTLIAPVMGFPFQMLHLYYLGPLNKVFRTGAWHFLTCRDSFSKWVQAFPMVNATAIATICLLEEIIHSGCGTQFSTTCSGR